MNQMKIAICDEDEDYGCRLMGYLTEHSSSSTCYYYYSNPEMFWESMKTNTYHGALMTEKFWDEEQMQLGVTRFLFFSEGDVPKKWECFPVVFRYQEAEKIRKEILENLDESDEAEDYIQKNKKEIIGVYSPHQHELQMLFSMTLGELLGEQKKTLYLNFMDCAGMLALQNTNQERDLGDLFCYTYESGAFFSRELEKMVQRKNHLEYIPPVYNPMNLHEAEEKDYLNLLRMLCEYTEYEVILLDLGVLFPGFLSVLKQCSRIYCPVKEGFFYQCRIHQFENCIRFFHEESLLERLQYVNVQANLKDIQTEEKLQESLLWGEIGEFIRSAILQNGAVYG